MVTLGYINERMSKIDNWSLENDSIIKDLTFRDFQESIKFVNHLGEVLNRHKHYPTIVISNDRVRLRLTTPSEKGLTDLDFEVAEAIDQLIKSYSFQQS